MGIDLNEDDIFQLVEIIEKYEFDELRLETTNFKLALRKTPVSSLSPTSKDLHLEHDSATRPELHLDKVDIRAQSTKEASNEATTITSLEEGLVPVKAPILGIFYRTSTPGAPAFVEEGSLVTENDTVCIIEVMKVFNRVAAGVRGVVARVCAEHGKMVEAGQTLFLIRADEEQQRGSNA